MTGARFREKESKARFADSFNHPSIYSPFIGQLKLVRKEKKKRKVEAAAAAKLLVGGTKFLECESKFVLALLVAQIFPLSSSSSSLAAHGQANGHFKLHQTLTAAAAQTCALLLIPILVEAGCENNNN